MGCVRNEAPTEAMEFRLRRRESTPPPPTDAQITSIGRARHTEHAISVYSPACQNDPSTNIW